MPTPPRFDTLVLASASPRRADLLQTAGFAFVVRPADVDERVLEGEVPEAYVRRVSRAKLTATAAAPDEVVLAADTTVVVDGEILGKPLDGGDARRMLTLLSGRTHDVLTGIAAGTAARVLTACAVTRVTFAALDPDDIDTYIASGEPFGKAGAYAIQGRGARFVTAIDGSWSNVVGLPVATVYRLLRRLGWRD